MAVDALLLPRAVGRRDVCCFAFIARSLRTLLLQEFVSSSSDPPQAIEREEVGDDRLH
jgi:hypothetical protein